MEIVEQTPFNHLNITACDGASAKINDILYQESFIIFDNQVIPWPVAFVSTLSQKDLHLLVPYQPECILIGTGQAFHYLEDKVMAPIIAANIGYECMKSATACGSYQLIAGDGRRVLAAIILEK